MDFLLLPSECDRNPVEVRLHDVDDYDCGPFLKYPERQDFDTRPVMKWQKMFEDPSSDFSAFLERWLLFGFIHVAFRGRIRRSDCVRDARSSADSVLTIDWLSSIFQPLGNVNQSTAAKLKDVVEMFAMAKDIDYAVTIHTLLMRSDGKKANSESAAEPMSLIKFIDTYGVPRDPRSPEITMVTCVVIEFWMSYYLSKLPTSHMRKWGNTSIAWKSLAWTQLRGEGWCPSELVAIFNRFNTSCFHFLRFLSRPGPHEEHQMIRIKERLEPTQDTIQSHSPVKLCTPFKCAHKKIETYHTKHADGCHCSPNDDYVAANQIQLCDILLKRKIPFIPLINYGEKGEIKLDEDVQRYVAISHVWSDGLGNLKRNALPRCQLLRLSNMVRSLPGEYSNIGWFWLDTICVPPDEICRPPYIYDFYRAQQEALDLMRKTYKEATTVLVLDSWLFNSISVGKSDEENLIRIFSCNWNTRLWTYQEGALAKRLHFQFKDAAYDLDHGIQELRNGADLKTQLTVLRPLSVRYDDLRGLRKDPSDPGGKIIPIAAALADRTTSVDSDEPLCLAVLLNLGVAKIEGTSRDERMKSFWEMLREFPLPQTLVFTLLPTFRDKGLRWAPLTFLRSALNKSAEGRPISGEIAMHGNRSGTFRNEGLTAEAPGLRFLCGDQFIGELIYIQDERGTWNLIKFHHDHRESILYGPKDGTKRYKIKPSDSGQCSEAGILFNIPETITTQEAEGTKDIYFLKRKFGILVAIHEEREGVIFCTRLCAVSSQTLEKGLDDKWLQELSNFREDSNRRDIYGNLVWKIGKTCPSQQRWCVG